MYGPALEASRQTSSLLLCCHKAYLLFILFLCPVYFSTPIKGLFLSLSPKYFWLQPSWTFIVFCLPLCSAKRTISSARSLHILTALNQDIIRLFFSKCFLFLRRGTKATSIINSEVFWPNKISLNILSKKMKWRPCIVNSLIHLVTPIIFCNTLSCNYISDAGKLWLVFFSQPLLILHGTDGFYLHLSISLASEVSLSLENKFVS